MSKSKFLGILCLFTLSYVSIPVTDWAIGSYIYGCSSIFF